MQSLKALSLGALSYLPYHFAIGFLASVEAPLLMKEIMRTYKRAGVVFVDLLLTALPLFVLFALLTYIAFRWLLRPSLQAGLSFASGWLCVVVLILAFGYYTSHESVAGHFVQFTKWPHTLITQFAPVLGSLVGTWLASKRGSHAQSGSAG